MGGIEKYNNDETTKIKFIIIRNGQPYMKQITWIQLNLHASLCDIFTDKYSYSNAKRCMTHFIILRQLVTTAIYICMGIA